MVCIELICKSLLRAKILISLLMKLPKIFYFKLNCTCYKDKKDILIIQ